MSWKSRNRRTIDAIIQTTSRRVFNMKKSERSCPPDEEILPCKMKGYCPYEYDRDPDRDIEGMPFLDEDPRSCPEYGHICPGFMEDFDLTVEDLKIRAIIHCGNLMELMVEQGEIKRNSPIYIQLMKDFKDTIKKYSPQEYPEYYL